MGLFQKEHTNDNFYAELTKSQFDKKWLKGALKSEFVDIDHQDVDGNTFLLRSLKSGNYRAVEWLIENGANIDIKNKQSKTAINIAIEKNSLAVVKGLLELGKIDPNQRDIDGRSLLQNVVVWGNHKMAKLLINKGADVNSIDNNGKNVLYDALAYGDRAFINYLLSLDQVDINQIDQNGLTLLQHPEVRKNIDIAKDLIISGIDTTVLTPEDESYLLQTILAGEDYIEIVDLALDHGANINSITHKGTTIMMEVIYIASTLPIEKESLKKYYLDMAQKMLKHGGDINATGIKSETLLFDTVRNRDLEIVAFLLLAGIDPNIQNEFGETALFELIYDGTKSLDLILLLIAYEADPNIKNDMGKTIYEILNDIILHQHGTKQIEEEEFLLKVDKNGDYLTLMKELLQRDDTGLEYYDSTGEPLFFKPLLYDYFPLFKLYINDDVDINLRNEKGHNLFYEYLLKIFEDNNLSLDVVEHFENNLSVLVSHKIEKEYHDETGLTILHKILRTPCNEKLFTILTKIVSFDYTITDTLGRTIIHSAVWANKPFVIQKVDQISHSKVINQPDTYGILPITYAALLGSSDLVLLFIRLGSNIHSDIKIADQAIKKFSPLLKNLPKLFHGIDDESDKEHIQLLVEQTQSDFKS